MTLKKNGAPARIRTWDPQIRSLILYPTELLAPSYRPIRGPQDRLKSKRNPVLHARNAPVYPFANYPNTGQTEAAQGISSPQSPRRVLIYVISKPYRFWRGGTLR